MNATLAEHEYELTPPPSLRPPARPSGGDRWRALAWIAGGLTADDAFSRSAGLGAPWTAEALLSVSGDMETAQSAADILSRIAGEVAEEHARLVEAMRLLEGERVTPETARAALGIPEPARAA